MAIAIQKHQIYFRRKVVVAVVAVVVVLVVLVVVSK